MITRASLEAARPYEQISGEAEDTGIPGWAVFELSGCTHGDTEAATERARVEVFDLAPLRDDEACAGIISDRGEPFDDFDAALAYLNRGGTLMKVPDFEGSEHYRFLVAVSIVV